MKNRSGFRAHHLELFALFFGFAENIRHRGRVAMCENHHAVAYPLGTYLGNALLRRFKVLQEPVGTRRDDFSERIYVFAASVFYLADYPPNRVSHKRLS